jgi:type VI secretion system protein
VTREARIAILGAMAASLLSRIERAADPTYNERYTSRDSDTESSVTAHLARLLNCRQGSALTVPDYGLIEVSEVLYDFPDAIGIMQRALKNTIQTYEPRLKNVQVRHLKSEAGHEMVLQFEITAQLHLPDGRRQSLRFSTAVDGSGNVKVQ